MAKINLSKVSTHELWSELDKRKAKENFTWYYIDLGEAYDRINPADEPRRFKTLKGEAKLRKQLMIDADNDLQDLFFDAEVGFWDSDVGYYYDDFFVDENK